jgi:hypothetical protein
MGRIVIIKNFARALREGGERVSDVIVDPGGGANITVQHYADPGDDSHPVMSDRGVIVGTPGKGRARIVGYADLINTPKALVGDKRIYSRDSNGASIAEIWLKNDGSIVVSNTNGNFELKNDGSIDINGDVVITGNLSVAGKDFITHTHPQANDSGGNVEVPTGVLL